jgi:dUTP pyrophosphatase
MELKFKKLKPEATLPQYAHDDDIGLDLFSCEDYSLEPGERYGFDIGIASEIQKGYGVLIKDKSKLGSLGIHVLGGVLDGGYRGEWKVMLINLSQEPYQIKKGDKIAQGSHILVEQPKIIEVDELSETARGTGGFGSTGK